MRAEYAFGMIQGGVIMFTADRLREVTDATARFAEAISDTKAQIITTYNSVLGEVWLRCLFAVLSLGRIIHDYIPAWRDTSAFL